MEAGTVAVGHGTPNPAQYMPALASAQRRRQEIAQLKRDLRAGRITAAEALLDARAGGAVTLGVILLAQSKWGRKRTADFLRRIGAPPTVMNKRVEDLTARQKAIVTLALRTPRNRHGISVAW